jgi:hypothetical protein
VGGLALQLFEGPRCEGRKQRDKLLRGIERDGDAEKPVQSNAPGGLESLEKVNTHARARRQLRPRPSTCNPARAGGRGDPQADLGGRHIEKWRYLHSNHV